MVVTGSGDARRAPKGAAFLFARFFVCSAEAAAVVRQCEVDQRPDRHDPGRIDTAVAAVIVTLDMVEVHRLGDARHLIEIAQVIPEIGIVDDAPHVALEVAVVDRVETHQRGEQPPVGFRNLPPDEITLARERRRARLLRRRPACRRSRRDKRRC